MTSSNDIEYAILRAIQPIGDAAVSAAGAEGLAAFERAVSAVTSHLRRFVELQAEQVCTTSGADGETH